MTTLDKILMALGGRLVGDELVATSASIIMMLLMCFVMGLYEFVIYRVVSRRSLYNKAFHITIMVIPFFIGSIVLILQSIVITLGTIGALAIIRFRTAVKDPIDMVYILWSIFIGITCGSEVYNLCVLTSLVVTVVLVIINMLSRYSLFKNPYVLVVNCVDDIENNISSIIKKYSKNYRIKSRNYTSKGVDYIFEINTKNVQDLVNEIKENKEIIQFSLIEYDNEDVI